MAGRRRRCAAVHIRQGRPGQHAAPTLPTRFVGGLEVPVLLVNRQWVFLTNRHNPGSEPAPILVWQPFGRIVGCFLVSVEPGGCQREIVKVAGESLPHDTGSRTEPGVVSLGDRNDMLDVRLQEALELGSVVRRPHATKYPDDPGFRALGVLIVAAVIRCASAFLRYRDAPPPSGRRRARYGLLARLSRGQR